LYSHGTGSTDHGYATAEFLDTTRYIEKPVERDALLAKIKELTG